MTAHDPLVNGPSKPAAVERWVLVVDDEPAIRSLVSRVLQGSGYGVVVARDGAQALELLERRKDGIHLVLTDIQMPRLGGLELGRELAARQWRIPVLYMSANPPDALISGDRLSQAACLQKPFSIRTLITSVRRLLAGRSTPLEQEIP